MMINEGRMEGEGRLTSCQSLHWSYTQPVLYFIISMSEFMLSGSQMQRSFHCDEHIAHEYKYTGRSKNFPTIKTEETMLSQLHRLHSNWAGSSSSKNPDFYLVGIKYFVCFLSAFRRILNSAFKYAKKATFHPYLSATIGLLFELQRMISKIY